MKDEDVAHLAVRASRDALLVKLDELLKRRGYVPHPLKDDCHLLRDPNWDSPFDPPPRYRCFSIIEDVDGWTTVTDELDLLDEELARELSRVSDVIAVKGHFAAGEYEYSIWQRGNRIESDDADSDVRAVSEAIEQNADHVTRFPYDEVILRREDLLSSGGLIFKGYRRVS
jgi:hypothetical protein